MQKYEPIISRKDFEIDFFKEKFKFVTNQKKILNFLVVNKDKAFTLREISKVLKLDYKYVSVMLDNLKLSGFVSHKRPYWIIKRKGIEKLEKVM